MRRSIGCCCACRIGRSEAGSYAIDEPNPRAHARPDQTMAQALAGLASGRLASRRFSRWERSLGHWHDPTLDRSRCARPVRAGRPRLVDRASWPSPFPEARAAARAYTAASLGDLLNRLTREDDLDIAWFLSEDDVPGRPDGPSRPAWSPGTAIAPRSSTRERATW